MFTNLIETDQVYGHRHDFEGFAGALGRIDECVARWLELLGEDDLLVLTADHGCDLTSPRTDHTREHAPLLARFAGDGGRRHDGLLADVGASVLEWLAGGADAAELPGARSCDPARRPNDRVPELPEVETIRRQLAPHLEGRTLRDVEILDARWTRPDAPGPVQDALRGRVVQRGGPPGKYLVWEL